MKFKFKKGQRVCWLWNRSFVGLGTIIGLQKYGYIKFKRDNSTIISCVAGHSSCYTLVSIPKNSTKDQECAILSILTPTGAQIL